MIPADRRIRLDDAERAAQPLSVGYGNNPRPGSGHEAPGKPLAPSFPFSSSCSPYLTSSAPQMPTVQSSPSS